MQTKPKVSIIIVNYKSSKEVVECIASIFNSKPEIAFEIILVDNDEDASYKKKLKKILTKVDYIKSGKNIGFGAGNNLGAKNASGEFLFFLNPDTLVEKGAIEALYRFLSKHKDVGMVSPLLTDVKHKPFDSMSRKELTPLNALYSFSLVRKIIPNMSIYNDASLKNWDKKDFLRVNTVPGAALMISKKLFEEVRGFDEKIFLYFEENDLSKRVGSLGYKFFLIPQAKIIHKVGKSTQYLNKKEKTFAKSRFYYLKKHYGFLRAFFTESLTRINLSGLCLFAILVVAAYLRLNSLGISMPFIGDQGWFYLSARDLILSGKIPLVGITSSHTWLHQGPLWTYMLSIAFVLFRFSPFSGAYITVIFGLLSTYAIYRVSMNIFSKKVGLIASSLYAVSPLIVSSDRTPFDPSLIPFFSLLYFYSLYSWTKGRLIFFPLIILSLAVLYNLELATFTLFFPFALIFFYFSLRRRSYIEALFKGKILFFSALAFFVPMFPVIIYDLSNGFKQTVVFFGWILYKPFSAILLHLAGKSSFVKADMFSFIFNNLQGVTLQLSLVLSLIFFAASVLYLLFRIYKTKFKISNPYFMLIFILTVTFIGIFASQTPSCAYFPVVFPFVILAEAIFFDFLLSTRGLKSIALIVFFALITMNTYASIKNSQISEIGKRLKAVDKIILMTKGERYNLIGRGEGSQFASFTNSYEYLLWWKGYPPSKKNEHFKIYVSEKNDKIIVAEKND